MPYQGAVGIEQQSPIPDIDFEALLTQSPNPYVLLDREFRLVWMNDAYLRVTMRSREELVGLHMFEAFPSDPESESHRLLEGSFNKALATGAPDELALIRYDITEPDGTMRPRYWSATHTPLRAKDGSIPLILQHTVDVTEIEGLRKFQDRMGMVRRAEAVQATNLNLVDQSRRLRSLTEQAPGFIAVLSGPEHRFELANRAYRDLVGGRNVIGKTLAEAVPEAVAQGFGVLLDEVLESGKPYVGHRTLVTIERDGGTRSDHYLDFIYQPIFGDGGSVSGVFVQGHDVSEEVDARERHQLLIDELNHRVKNTLAVVQGLAAQSFREVEGSEDARATFEARLKALSAAHSLLTERSWRSASLTETISNSVEATAGKLLDRVSMEGPDIALSPQTAVSLSMIVHELSTNAIKYGALSNDKGRVAVHWWVQHSDGGRELILDWIESGGPPVAEPTRRGFGSRLIERGVAAGRQGNVSMSFEPGGLHCQMSAPLPEQGG